MFVGICDGAACTFFNEEYGDSAADTAVATGDEGNLVKKFTCSRTIVFGDGLWSHLFLMAWSRLRLGFADFLVCLRLASMAVLKARAIMLPGSGYLIAIPG